MSTVNAGARLDRLPISSFHHRIFWLIGAGMFFDGYDLYVGTTVLAAARQSGFSTAEQIPQFISLTFLGMTIGSLIAGFLGDRYGRRFTYQFNLLVFGIASLAAALAPSMAVLNWVRFVIGLGLGAEIVVGYSTLTEFVPPRVRGRWLAFMAFIVVSGLPVTVLLGTLIIPSVSAWGVELAKETSGLAALLLPGLGWRLMFLIAGIGAFVVWYLRKALPESPRWLEAQGRTAEAEALLRTIEQETGAAALPPPAPALAAPVWTMGALLGPALLPRLVVGCVTLISINTLIFGFVLWLPQFFIQQGHTIARSFVFTLIISFGSIAGCAVGALVADRLGRRRSIIGASLLTILFGAIYPFVAEPALLISVGFLLVVSIYVQVSILFGVYTPELFPTEVRLRANGICNTLGRAATIVSPFLVAALLKAYGVGGVLALMIGLLIIQIIVVAGWGIEPANRRLEELETDVAGAPGAPRAAEA